MIKVKDLKEKILDYPYMASQAFLLRGVEEKHTLRRRRGRGKDRVKMGAGIGGMQPQASESQQPP